MKKLLVGDILGLLNGINVKSAILCGLLFMGCAVQANEERPGYLHLVDSQKSGEPSSESEHRPSLKLLDTIESITGYPRLSLIEEGLSLEVVRDLEAKLDVKFDDIVESNPLVAAKTFVKLRASSPLIWTQGRWEEMRAVLLEKLNAEYEVEEYGGNLKDSPVLLELNETLQYIVALGGELESMEKKIKAKRPIHIVDKSSITKGLKLLNPSKFERFMKAQENMAFLSDREVVSRYSHLEKVRLLKLSQNLVPDEPLIEELFKLVFVEVAVGGNKVYGAKVDWLGEITNPLVSLSNEFPEVRDQLVQKLLELSWESQYERTFLESILESFKVDLIESEEAKVQLGQAVAVSVFKSMSHSNSYLFEPVSHRFVALEALLTPNALDQFRFEWLMASIRQSGLNVQSQNKVDSMKEQIQSLFTSSNIDRDQVLELAQIIGVEPLPPVLVKELLADINIYLLDQFRHDIIVVEKMLDIFSRAQYPFVKHHLRSWVDAEGFVGKERFVELYAQALRQALDNFFFESAYMEPQAVIWYLRKLIPLISAEQVMELAQGYLLVEDNLLVIGEIKSFLQKLSRPAPVPQKVMQVGCWTVLIFDKNSDTTDPN